MPSLVHSLTVLMMQGTGLGHLALQHARLQAVWVSALLSPGLVGGMLHKRQRADSKITITDAPSHTMALEACKGKHHVDCSARPFAGSSDQPAGSAEKER